ncbi:MAG: polysaccharide deacetylase family protein, partial [Bacillota bacterium]
MKKKGLYFIGIIILLAGAFYYFWPRPGVQPQFQQQPVTRLGEEGRVAVLEYHDFNSPGGFSISGEQFRRQLQALRQAGYTLITPEEFRDWLQGKKEIKDKSILLTIDDGYASVAEIVPILREFKARALVFLVTSRTGKPKLTDAQLQEFADVLRPEFFVYPYGVNNSDVIQLLKEHGIKFAFGTRPGLVTRKSDPWYLPRFEVGMPSFTPERLLAMLEVEFGKREAFSGWQLAGTDNFQPRIFWLEEGQIREALQITGPGWKFQKITRDQLGPFRRWQLSWEKENGEKLVIDLYSVPGGGMYLLEWTPVNQDSKLVYHWQRVGEKGPWQVRTISYRPSQYGPYSQLASMVT